MEKKKDRNKDCMREGRLRENWRDKVKKYEVKFRDGNCEERR